MASETMLRAALAFARQGIPVFPCKPRSKEPMTEHGFKDSTTDVVKVGEWWTRWPLANIGIPTGAMSGIVSVDIDPRHGGDKTLAEMGALHGHLPETKTVRTGRGKQFWFEHPGKPVRCSAGVLGPGVDIRGDGGYVIAPHSIHPNGQQYALLNNRDLAEMPEWLIRLTVQAKSEPNPNHDSDGKIPEGSRNAKLTSIAGSLRRQGLPEADICEALRGINSRRCNPPLSEVEVGRIAASIAKHPPGADSPSSCMQPEGFSLVSVGELLARPETPVDWVWQDHLAAGTVSGVFSKPKVGKSTFSRNLCVSVARGADFLGLPVKKGLCCYLALEERLEDVVSDFRAMGATGDEEILVHADAIPSAGILALIGLVREWKPVLVVIDPLFRMVHIKDEKAYAETYAALGPLIDVARSFGTHILVTHHAGKGVKLDPVDSPLGSTGIAGACSSLVILKRTEAYRTIQTVQRLGQDMPEAVLQYDPEKRLLSVGGTRFETDRAECEKAIIEFFRGAVGPQTQAQIRDGVEGQTRVIRAALTRMIESGRVAKSGDGTKGKPFNYEFPNNGSHYIRGTSKPESEKVAQTRMDTGSILVPEDTQKTILVSERKQPSEGAISSESKAVENVAEGSLFTPLLEGESVGTANPKGDSTPESWTKEI